MLDDFAMTPARVSRIVPCGNQSWIDAVLRGRAARGTAILVRGVTLPGVDQRADRQHLLHRAGLVDVAAARASRGRPSGDSVGSLASYVG